MRSHAARRSFFIQKRVLRGRLLGRIFALSFQKQIFRTQFGLDAVAPGAGAFGFVAPHVLSRLYCQLYLKSRDRTGR